MTDPETATTRKAQQTAPTQNSLYQTVFFGPNGLRAGWRVLIFVVISRVLARALFALAAAVGFGSGLFARLTPLSAGFGHGLVFVATLLAALVMARFERRRFGVYGLPVRSAFQGDFWIGGLVGFGAISGALGLIAAFHGLQISGLAIQGRTIVVATITWGIAFVLVGLAEEFSYRGYLQYTLTTGIGFWPAAILLSVGFAVAHARNSGESAMGLVSVVFFALLFCLFLRRRGNLWLAVGFHAGWDWGETFFYGTPDSGLLPSNNLLNSVFSGPHWLTGGQVGPEASIFTPLMLAFVAIIFSSISRAKQ